MCWEALRVFIEYVSPFCRRRQWWIKGDRDRGSWTLGPVLIKLISALKFETLWMICSRGVRSEGPTLLWTGLSRRIFLPRSFAQTEWCRDLKARFLRPRVIHLFHASSLGVWISLTRLLPGWVSHYTKPGGLGEGVQTCSSFELVHPVSPLCFLLVMPLEANKPGVELQFNSDCLGDLGKKMSSLRASPSSSIKWGLT